jgi:hypothetical protein
MSWPTIRSPTAVAGAGALSSATATSGKPINEPLTTTAADTIRALTDGGRDTKGTGTPEQVETHLFSGCCGAELNPEW